MKLRLFYPVKPVRITQVVGLNGEWYQSQGINIKGHNGLDFLTTHGLPVRATHSGEIVYAGCDNKEGYGVVLRTTEPYDYGENKVFFKTIYWHLIKDIPVKVGQSVNTGDIIGYADNTGLSTGDHLHFALKPQVMGEDYWVWFNLEDKNGYMGAIDPMPYFNGICAEDALSTIQILKGILD